MKSENKHEEKNRTAVRLATVSGIGRQPGQLLFARDAGGDLIIEPGDSVMMIVVDKKHAGKLDIRKIAVLRNVEAEDR